MDIFNALFAIFMLFFAQPLSDRMECSANPECTQSMGRAAAVGLSRHRTGNGGNLWSRSSAPTLVSCVEVEDER